jgi:diguanylate cyclase (GGDEF)-like protein
MFTSINTTIDDYERRDFDPDITPLDTPGADHALRAERAALESELRRLVVGARCLHWRGEARLAPSSRGHGETLFSWAAHVVNEDYVREWLPLETCAGESYWDALSRSLLPDDRGGAHDNCRSALLSGAPEYTQEFRVELADGRIAWLSERVRVEALGPDRWLCDGICIDITEQKLARQELERQVVLAGKAREELEQFHGTLAQDNAKLEALVALDGLTGLKNHRALVDRLAMQFEAAVHDHTPLSLIMLDVDRFKPYNDTYGHIAGDEVLRTVAQILQKHARDMDVVARYGGEEFAVILTADQETAITVAERLRIAIEQADWPKRAVTASFGVATFGASTPYPDISSFVADADSALYYSKERSRNRVTHARVMARYKASPGPHIGINCGGDAVPSSVFGPDAHCAGGRDWRFSFKVETEGVDDPAPDDVYRTERVEDFSYAVPDLIPGARYLVRLHFAEGYWEEAGERLFDVAINGRTVLKDFDIIGEAGAIYAAIVKEFIAVPGEGGVIAIDFRSVRDIAKVSGIEIAPFPYRNAVSVNCGGGVIWPFMTDTSYRGGKRSGAEAACVPADFDIGELEGLVPDRIYQTERYGSFSYIVDDLKPGGCYLVRLHFSEFHWEQPGQRVFDVVINGSPVLTDFDILAEAGVQFKSVLKEFPAEADGDGRLHLDFAGVVDNAQVNAIEILW